MNRAGDIAELSFLLEATKRHLDIFTPWSHDTKADCIVMQKGCQPVTIQIKKGTLVKQNIRPTFKVLVGSAKSSNRLNNGTPRYTRYTANDFNILAIQIGPFGWSFWRIEDVCHQSTFRWNENKGNRNNWDLIETYHKQ